MLAQIDREEALTRGYSNLALIGLIGALAVLVMVVMIFGRRWKRRQLNAIEQDKAARRAGRSVERTDAWQTSSDRYVDHDKLPPPPSGAAFDHDHEEEPFGDGPPTDSDDFDDEEPERDPYGLFEDQPYEDPEDEDDLDDEDEDWGGEDDPPNRL